MKPFPGKLSFLAAACLLSNVASYASASTSYLGRYARKNNSPLTPFNSRATLDGAAANQQGFLYGDMMLPIFGNTEGIVFLDGTGKGGTDKGWLGAFGGGVRQIWNGAIFGGYVFGERDHVGFGDYFWTINPGVEFMTPHWEAHVNGYFPVSGKEHVLSTTFADQMGLTGFPITFKGRQQFGEAFNFATQVAPGMDAEVAYTIPNLNRTRLIGGGYYFWFNHAMKIGGGALGVEIPINQTFSLLFRDTYDNLVKNTAVFTLRVRLGGINKVCENDIHERMLDIIPRHIGVLYTGAGIPSQQATYDAGQQLERDNIWFFRSGTTVGSLAVGPNSCTYENPCNSDQFTQSNIAAINGISPTAANFYVAPANYLTGAITLYPNQSLYGRTPDFTLLASGSNLPTIYGNITLSGNNVLAGVQIFNQLIPNGPSAGFNTGINVAGSHTLIEQVVVGPSMSMKPFAPVPIGSFQTGILVNNAQGVLIDKSIINAGDAETSTAANATGLSIINGSFADLQYSTVNVRSSQTSYDTDASTNAYATGIKIACSDMLLINNTINVLGDATVTDTPTDSPSLIIQPRGIYAQGNIANAYTVLLSINNKVNVLGYAQSLSAEPTVPTVTATGLSAQAIAPYSTMVVISENDTINLQSKATNSYSGNASVVDNAAVFASTGENATASQVIIDLMGDTFNLNLQATSNSGQAYVGNIAALKSGIYSNNSTTAINSEGDTFIINTHVASKANNTLQKGIYGVVETHPVANYYVSTYSQRDTFVINGTQLNPPPSNVPLMRINGDTFAGRAGPGINSEEGRKAIGIAAGVGAVAGSAFGPLGNLIGAGLGALVGLFSAL